MEKAKWKKIIEDQIKIDKEYLPSFQTTIEILAEILEERDRVYSEYKKSGAEPLVKFTTDRGAVNMKPNPLMRQWQDLNVSALSYLRELGLTAAGLRKLQGTLPQQKTISGLQQFELEFADDSPGEVPELKTTKKRKERKVV